MFLGHLGVDLALKKLEPEVNLGALVAASMLPDVLLGVFTLAGVEQVVVPENFSQLRYLHFIFPYSHSFVAALLWALVVFGLSVALWRGRPQSRWRAAGVITAAYFLHWLGDVIVHPAQIPLAGNTSPMLGLGLWNHLGLAIALELLLAGIGLVLYWSVKSPADRKARWGVLALMLAMALTSIGGQVFSPVAPPPQAAAWSWIFQTVLLSGLGYWLDKPPASTRIAPLPGEN